MSLGQFGDEATSSICYGLCRECRLPSLLSVRCCLGMIRGSISAMPARRAGPMDLPVANGSSSSAGHEVYESQENDGADRGADDLADDA